MKAMQEPSTRRPIAASAAAALRRAAVEAGARPVVEFLEGRQLMAVDLGAAATSVISWPATYSTRAVTQPSVNSLNPANNATGVARDTYIAVNFNLPNGGLLKSTVETTGNVTLVRASDGKLITNHATLSGGGDSVTVTPPVTLEANTKYRFSISSAVTDVTGTPLVAFTSVFTTGTTGGSVSSAINFAKVQQNLTAGKQYTCVTVGPDGKLYAATFDGLIRRFTVGADGTLSGMQEISTVNTKNGAARTITGIVFDPASTASNLIAWVTHTEKADLNGTNFTGKVSRLSGADLGTYQDYVTNLPRSVRDHLTNQAVFKPGQPTTLYVSQAANNAMGAPDTSWGSRAESLLSAAILKVDLAAIATRIANGQGPLNVKTVDAGGSYNPYAAGAPLTLYATGVRNGYDMVWASNGNLYTAVNGSAAGGNVPASSASGRRPPTGTAYAGPAVPGFTNVRVTEHDWLFKITAGRYYGHPNPSRGQFVFNGGNPTSGVDPQELADVYYPVGTLPDANWDKAAYDFGMSQSPDGMIQYKSGTFGGLLKDKLLVVRYAGGDDIVALTLKADGSVDGTKTMTGLGGGIGSFVDPVDLTEYVNPANASDPRNGMLFVAEYGGERITLLRPAVVSNDPGGAGVGGPAAVTPVSGSKIKLSRGALVFNAVRGATSPTVKLTISNTGSSALNITGLTLGGTEPGNFAITGNGGLPGSIAAGASVTVSLVYKAPSTTALGLHTATLTVASDDATKGSIVVGLRGVATAGTGGQNEPSLQRLFDAYQLGIATGDKNAGNTNLFSPAEPLGASDEVTVQTLVKATTGPVTVQPLFTFAGGSPVVRFGTYTPGSASSRNELFTIGSADAQTTAPTAVGTTSFDPGATPFGVYATFPIFSNTAYSQDNLNVGEGTGANRRKVRFYPLKDGTGAVVPNAYVFTTEDFTNDPSGGYDTNDFAGIIRNVKANTAGQGLTLSNLDGVAFDDRISVSRINVQPPEPLIDGTTGLPYNPPPNVVHDQATVRLTNTSGGPITINGLTLSNATAWKVVSGPAAGTVLAAGASTLVTVKFIATKPPATTVNETIDPSGNAKNFNGTYVNTLTIASTDPTNPNRVITLAGYFQNKNEQDQEPSAQTIVNKVYGYATKITNPGQVLNTGGQAVAVGEEILTDYWRKADATAPVTVRQLAAYHTQGNTATINWFAKGATGTLKKLFTHAGVEGQSLIPTIGGGIAAAATFNPTGDFGLKIDNEWSVDSLNKQEQAGGGYGHHVRFWPARDRSGNLIPDTYIVGMDYLSKNFDYQDNLYLVTNIKAANGASPNPDPTGGAPALAGLTLMDAATDTDLGAFAGTATIDLSGGKQYTVRADPAAGGTAASAVFAVDGVIVRTESFAPWSIAGEVGTDYTPWNVPLGTHTLTVTPFSGTGGTGTPGTPITVTFTATTDGTNPTPTAGVTGLVLVDAATDLDVGPLTDGTVIDPAGGKQYSVRAVAADGTKSVVFKLDGATVRTESSAPYTIAGDAGMPPATDYLPWTLPAAGQHTLVVQGFDASGGTGTAGSAVTVTFTVGTGGTDPTPTLGVTGLVLVDAATNLDVGPLTDGAVIDASGGKQYNVRAVTATGTKSVVFAVDGGAVRTESAAPFTIAGDSGIAPNVDYLPWTLPANGAHTLVATGFGATGGTGTAGSAVTVSFTVVNNVGTPPPTGAGSFFGINVGAPPVGGSVATTGTGAWTVRGSGTGTGGTKDQLLFAQQTRTGDFDVKAKLASLSGGMTGLALRSGTSGGNSAVELVIQNGNVMFCTRIGFGTALQVQTAGTATPGNVWFRMKRTGNTVTAYFGTDGANWTQAGTVDLAGTIPSSANFGFVAAGGASLNTAKWEQAAG
ncbi:MAG TPA: choice-of-anchor D domain-containing protein [Humisphaera sp.]